MLKSELIEKIAAQNPHLYRQDAEKIVNTILDTITAALAQGDRVELRGFGVFTAKTRKPRTGRDPRDGAKVAVPQKVTPAFKTRACYVLSQSRAAARQRTPMKLEAV